MLSPFRYLRGTIFHRPGTPLLETLIKETSRQGKRTDLEKETAIGTDNGTCVQSRHKLTEKPKRITIRDKMSNRLGISTATLSKYRRIIKLPDDLLRSLEQLLDEKRITFEAAYTIANYMPDYLLISSKKKILRSPVKSRILRIFHSRGREDRTPINGFGDRRTTIVLFPCTPFSTDESYYNTGALQ